MYSFDNYLDEIVMERRGEKIRRRTIWSIPHINRSRDVWDDCMKRNGLQERKGKVKGS
jgi:hypothetical protein